MDVDAGGRRICDPVAPCSNQVLLEFKNMLQAGGSRDAVSRGTIASTLIQIVVHPQVDRSESIGFDWTSALETCNGWWTYAEGVGVVPVPVRSEWCGALRASSCS